MSIDKRFKRGLELFNEGEFFECHEVIEDLWLETKKDHPHRDLYKGVIQAAASIYQLERGILSGAFGLYRSATRYLEKYTPTALGLNVDGLIRGLKNCFSAIKQKDPKELLVDKTLVPKLDFNFENE